MALRSLVHGYDELRLRIDRREAGSYHVLASTRLAEASASFELPFNELEIENFILQGEPAAGSPPHRHLGARRRAAVRRRPVQGAVPRRGPRAVSRRAGPGAQRERGVRITLCLSGSPELIDVPWEYLFDDPDFLAVSAFTPVVRYLDLPRAHRPLLGRAAAAAARCHQQPSRL